MKLTQEFLLGQQAAKYAVNTLYEQDEDVTLDEVMLELEQSYDPYIYDYSVTAQSDSNEQADS